MKRRSLAPESGRLRTKRGWTTQAGAELACAAWMNKLIRKGVWGISHHKEGASAHGTNWGQSA